MAMEVASRGSSLNPNAPLFVPMAYRMVEDFSDEWWVLIQSSPWFRDYWLQERYLDSELDNLFSDFDSFLPEDDELFDDSPIKQEEECFKELISVGGIKWRKGRPLAEAPRYAEKVPKNVNVGLKPRLIQQPR